jgi:hypothetical protein
MCIPINIIPTFILALRMNVWFVFSVYLTLVLVKICVRTIRELYIYDVYIIVFKTRVFGLYETVGFGSKMGLLPAAQQHLVKCFLSRYF